MSNIAIIILIFVISLVLSVIHFKNSCFYNSNEDKKTFHNNAPWQYTFIEIWNRLIGFFLGGLAVYYFISVRWNAIFSGEALNLSDFVIFIVIAMGILGWLPYFIRNVTEGITAILQKVLNGK